MPFERFDSYYVWLGIPPDQQPPTHYRLLGLAHLEANPDVIENAGEQRMAHLRTVQAGPHGLESQQLLGEIAAAMRVLLDPARKAAYDAQLQAAKLKPPPRRSAAEMSPTGKVPGPLPMSLAERAALQAKATAAMPAAVASSAELSDGHSWLPVVLIGGGVLLAMGLLLAVAGSALVWRRPASDSRLARNNVDRPLPPIMHEQPADSPDESPNDAPPPATETADPSAESSESEPPTSTTSNDPPVEEPSPPPGPVVRPPPPTPTEPAPAVDETPPVEPAPDPAPTSESAAPQRLKSPSPAEQKLLLDRLAEVYPPDNIRTGKQASAIAEELLALGSEANTPPADRFVLLRRAAELAVAAGDAELLSRAVAPLGEAFDVDAVDIEGAMLVRMAAEIDVSNSSAFARSAATFAEVAAADGNYDIAVRVLAAADALPASVLGETSRQGVRQQLAALRQRQERYSAIETAERAVAANPQDAAAHALLGTWYCCEQHDWPRGLAHLARGSDASLRSVAALDLAGAATPAAQLAIANAWWDAAQASSGADKTALEQRAFHWYQLVEPSQVSGLDRALLAKRLESFNVQSSSSAPAPASEEDGERYDAMFAKALAAVREKRYGDADRLFAHCVRMRPDDPAAANNYALTALRVGQTQRAVKQWQRLLAAGVSGGPALHNLERLRQAADREDLPIDRTSRATLDELIASASEIAGLARYNRRAGWQYQQPGGGATAVDDRFCLRCSGLGKVDCPEPRCSRGKVRVLQSQVVGRNTVTGEAIVQMSPVGVRCEACYGAGMVECVYCDGGGIDGRLR